MAVVALAILAVAIMLPNAANNAVNNVLRQYKRPATTPPQNDDDANLECARETIAQDGIESVLSASVLARRTLLHPSRVVQELG